MSSCSDYIKSTFPLIDDDLKQYVEDVLENGVDDFETSDEVYEAIGEVLQEISRDKSESDIRNICDDLLNMLKPKHSNGTAQNGARILNAPVHLASMAARLENNVEEVKSIWLMQRDESLKVDARKLEKAQAKLQEKQEKRSKDTKVTVVPKLETATASQVTSKKENKLEAKGMNKTQDIRIENFDIAYGDKVGRKVKTSPQQWAVLLNFAEQHPEILTTTFDTTYNKKQYNELWDEISQVMNSYGHQDKSRHEWQKAVANWKFKVRGKAAAIKTNAVPLPVLKENEKRLLDLLNQAEETGGVESTTATDSDSTSGVGPMVSAIINMSEHSYHKTNVQTETPQFIVVEQVGFQSNESRDMYQQTPAKRMRIESPQTESQDLKDTIRTELHELRLMTMETMSRLSNSLNSIAESTSKLAESTSKLAETSETFVELLIKKFQ